MNKRDEIREVINDYGKQCVGIGDAIDFVYARDEALDRILVIADDDNRELLTAQYQQIRAELDELLSTFEMTRENLADSQRQIIEITKVPELTAGVIQATLIDFVPEGLWPYNKCQVIADVFNKLLREKGEK